VLALSLRAFHQDWSWFVVIGNGLAGVWGLAAHRYTALRHKALWWFTAIVEIAIFVSVVLGIMLVKREHREYPKLHTFYGFVAIITVAIVYSYRNQLKGKTYLLYGGGSLFLMGLAIRAMVLKN
jgi:hypothetical protein